MMSPGSQSSAEHPHDRLTADQRIEKAVAEIAGVIRLAEPEKRGELKELAEALLHDEISSIAEGSTPVQTAVTGQRSNPLFAGFLIALLGGGFFLIFPFVGLALAVIGAILMIWGAVLSWRKG